VTYKLSHMEQDALPRKGCSEFVTTWHALTLTFVESFKINVLRQFVVVDYLALTLVTFVPWMPKCWQYRQNIGILPVALSGRFCPKCKTLNGRGQLVAKVHATQLHRTSWIANPGFGT